MNSEAILKVDTLIHLISTCDRGCVERNREPGEGEMRGPGLVCGDWGRHPWGLDVSPET